jgi:hypothetical protein
VSKETYCTVKRDLIIINRGWPSAEGVITTTTTIKISE